METSVRSWERDWPSRTRAAESGTGASPNKASMSDASSPLRAAECACQLVDGGGGASPSRCAQPTPNSAAQLAHGHVRGSRCAGATHRRRPRSPIRRAAPAGSRERAGQGGDPSISRALRHDQQLPQRRLKTRAEEVVGRLLATPHRRHRQARRWWSRYRGPARRRPVRRCRPERDGRW